MNIYKDITLILVAYRSENLILKNLDILKKFPVIIVDNSNSDELNSIIDEFDNIKFIRSNKNLGYGVANNLAISYSATPFILNNSIKYLLQYLCEIFLPHPQTDRFKYFYG